MHCDLGSAMLHTPVCIKSISNNKFLDLTKFKAFADDKSHVARIMVSQQDRVGNIWQKRKCFFSHNFFKGLLSQGRKKVELCGKELTHSLEHQFKTVPNSKKLQTTTEMWLSKGI